MTASGGGIVPGNEISVARGLLLAGGWGIKGYFVFASTSFSIPDVHCCSFKMVTVASWSHSYADVIFLRHIWTFLPISTALNHTPTLNLKYAAKIN